MQENRVDLQLIEACNGGDQKAFNGLVIRYQSRVSKIVGRFIKDQSEALDVCQEVFIKAYKALPKFRGDSSFYTWLYRIAINTSKNYIVSQDRRLPDFEIHINDLDNFLEKNSLKEYGTPEHIMMRDEIENVVFVALDHLPQELREAITLRELQGMSYVEIANTMKCPVGTVRSRIFRARAAIDKSVQPFL